jgi:hypothetical protein
MLRIVPCVFCLSALLGCSPRNVAHLASSASFDAHPHGWGGANQNEKLTAEIRPDGDYDQIVLIRGAAPSPFSVTLGLSQQRGTASHSATAEILLQFKDGKLSPLDDWEMSGGGERPAMRREHGNELIVYYPTELKGERTWVRFKIVMEK